jgi:hypothetical protein
MEEGVQKERWLLGRGEKFLSLLFVLFFPFVVWGQLTPQPFGNPIDSLLNREMDSIPFELPMDVLGNLKVYSFQSPWNFSGFSDTSLVGFELDLPEETSFIAHQQLGFPGSAARDLYFDPFVKRGWQSGISVYQPYLLTPEQTDFVETELPFAFARYTQRGTQANNHFQGLLASPFAKGVHVNLRLINLNHGGAYTHQQSKHNFFSLGLKKQEKGSPWRHYFNMAFNSLSYNENGGVTEGADFDNPFTRFRTDIPVSLTDARSKYIENHFYLRTDYALPILEEKNFKSFLSAKLSSKSQRLLFADRSAARTSYYGNYLTDVRGIRHSLEASTLGATLSLMGVIEKEEPSEPLFDLGLEFRNTRLNQEGGFEESIGEVFAKGEVAIPISFATLRGEGWYRLPGQWGRDLLLKPSLLFDFGTKLGSLEGGMWLRIRPPNQMERRVVITQTQVFDNDFSNEFSTGIFGTLSIPFLHLWVEGRLWRMDNALYFNASFMPQQLAEQINLAQLRLQHRLATRWFFSETQVALQSASQAVLGLPPYWLRNSAGLNTVLFGDRFEVRLGYSLVLMPSYRALGYFPVVANFYFQEEKDTGFYPVGDLFVNCKIKEFRFGLSVENASNLFMPGVAFPTHSFPERDWQLRFSLGWILWN